MLHSACLCAVLLSVATSVLQNQNSPHETVRIPLPHLLALTILWASAPARCHLSGTLGGVSHPPPTLRGSRTWGCSTPTDHQDGRTCSPCQNLGDCLSWATGAAPPAGSLQRCSRATSSLFLQDLGLRSRFLALPWPLTTRWPQNLLTALFCPLRYLVTKLLFRFLTWVKCGAQGWSLLQERYILVPTCGWAPVQRWETPGVWPCLLRVQP